MAKMWAGRTSGITDSIADDFNSSIRFDCKMYKEDITGSMAHAAMLAGKGIISQADADQLMGKFRISGVPICKDGKLVGILTNRDLKFQEDYTLTCGAVMTKDNLITAPVNTSLADAKKILAAHKIEKLPLVDDNFALKGLITIKDIEKAMQEGYSTATDNVRSLGFGAGMGLPNMKRYTDFMEIKSTVGEGTDITMRVDIK